MHPEYAALIQHVEACRARGRLDEAEGALQAIVRANPREHYAWGLLGLIAVQRGDAQGALEPIGRAARLDRDNPQYLNLLGVAYGELGRFADALATLRKAVRARPAYAESHYNLGKVLQKTGDLEGARDAFRRAAAIDARYPGARYMLGLVLQQLGDCDAAVAVLEQAVADDPADDWSLVQLGKALMATRGHAAASELYRAAAGRRPASGMIQRNLAHALLAAGRFREGWDAYARRDFPGASPRDPLPAALPADLRGRTVLLRSEQGLGDILFFLRFAPALVERGARLLVAAPAKLVPLLARVHVFENVLDERARMDLAFDVEITVADLPFLVGADAAPPELPLAPRPVRVANWRARLAAFGPAPYVGVTWRAGTDFRRRAEFGGGIQSLFKEAPIGLLAPVLARVAGTLVSLQRAPDAGEVDAFGRAAGRPVLDAAPANEDLEEALALLALLDDYVGVSNTNTHLRAAVGRPARVLVPFPPEWRWMAAGEASPWFPGFAVYRQSPARRWDEALARLAHDLGG